MCTACLHVIYKSFFFKYSWSRLIPVILNLKPFHMDTPLSQLLLAISNYYFYVPWHFEMTGSNSNVLLIPLNIPRFFLFQDTIAKIPLVIYVSGFLSTFLSKPLNKFTGRKVCTTENMVLLSLIDFHLWIEVRWSQGHKSWDDNLLSFIRV